MGKHQGVLRAGEEEPKPQVEKSDGELSQESIGRKKKSLKPLKRGQR